MADVEEKLKEIMASLFQVEERSIHPKFSQDDTPTWDSLQHLNLVLAIEEEFGLSITPEESTEMLNFSLIVLLVQEKIKIRQ